MLRIADTDAAAVVNRHPGCAGGRVDERVEQRPIGNRIASVDHPLGLAVGRRYRARVEMVAPDHDGRFDFAALHQLVHCDAELCALAITEPANPRRQSLKVNSFSCELHPARERLVSRKQFEREPVGARDIFGIAAQRDPSKWPATFTKQRTNVFGNKPGNIECILDASLFRLRANVVSVIKSDGPFFLQSEHGLDVNAHRMHCPVDVFLGTFHT